MDPTEVHVQVSLDFETGETDVTGEDLVLLFGIVFLLQMGEGRSIMREARIANQTTGLSFFFGQ